MRAQDATWLANPGSNNFDTGANWSSGSVPTGTASFGASSTTDLAITGSVFVSPFLRTTTIGILQFAAGSPAYTFTNGTQFVTLNINGAGIVNNSANVPTINNSSRIRFLNGASAGDAVITGSGIVEFQDSATAGNATIAVGFAMTFSGNSSAGNARISTSGGGSILFTGTASAGTAVVTVNGGRVDFTGGPTADQARFVLTTPITSALDISQAQPITIGSLEGAGGIVTLGFNRLTIGTNNLSTTFDGVITNGNAGNGGLMKAGGGTLTLTGASDYVGGTTVTGGRLLVTGSLASGVAVASGGELAGTATIGGAVTNAGIVTAGNSFGTMTVNGNFSQTAGGTYRIAVNAGGQNGRLTVNGTASLGGTVNVMAQPGTYARNTSYTILSATGGVSGNFAGVTSNFAFLAPTLRYDANNVMLDLLQSGFAAGARTPNQAAVGGALDSASANATGDLATVLTALANLDTTQGPRALDAISGQTYSGFSSVMVQGSQLFMNSFQIQAGSGSGSGGSGAVLPGGSTYVALRANDADACDTACDVERPWGAWGGGIGAFGTVAGNANASGLTYNLGGFIAGLDRKFAPGFRAGVATGFNAASLYSVGTPGTGTSNTLQFALYGAFSDGPLYLDALAGYGHSDNRMTRPIVIPGLPFRSAQGYANANTFFGQLEAGYKVDVAPRFGGFVTPFARLQASTSTQNGFSETGADSLNLTVAAQTTQSLRSVLGAQLGAAIDAGWRDKLNLLFRLGWSHEYADLTRPVTAAFAGAPALSFTTQGAIAPRDGMVLGLAANTAVGEATSLYFRYDGDLAGGNTSHVLSGGLRVVW